MKTIQHGLEPVADRESTMLILGSFPGPESLCSGEYYAYRQNRFWQLMQRICGVDTSLSYTRRRRGLLRNGIALWDSLGSCARSGALDRSKGRGTERPNDFTRFFDSHKRITEVVFTGRRAESAFRRLVHQDLGTHATALSFTLVPSTSPANTRYSLSQLESAWGLALRQHRDAEQRVDADGA